MDNTVSEVLEFARANDVKFVRMTFCDLLGRQKNISIMPDALEEAFTTGVPFDGSNITGFADITRSDLLLKPDPATLSVLPWRPQQGRVIRFFCNIANPDQAPFACDTRALLQSAAARCAEQGYACRIGTECEFYLFKTDDNGEPLQIPFDNGGYLDVSPLDRGENVRREICLALEEMGIRPENSHHEGGPGQNEIDFKYSGALNAADDFLSFKYAVKAIAARNGLFASFMPKPLRDKNGSGLHINLSLFRDGRNIFTNETGRHSQAAESFIAGVLARTAEMTVFLNPLANSYERFGSFEAPRYVSWSHQNRSQLIRIPAAVGEKTRMELRSPDPSANPYIAFALILHAGLDGIEAGLELQEPLDVNLYTPGEAAVHNAAELPRSLAEAVALAANSPFIKRALDEQMLRKYIDIKTAEADAFARAGDGDTFYMERYFRTE